jgi:type II secretory pathway component GspD/PulD (secretin)
MQGWAQGGAQGGERRRPQARATGRSRGAETDRPAVLCPSDVTMPLTLSFSRSLLTGALRSLLLGVPLLAAGCSSTLPDVAGSQQYRDSLMRWQQSMAASRAGEGLPRTEAEIPPDPVIPEPEPEPVPLLVEDRTPFGFSLRDAELGHALLMLGEQAGLNVVLDGEFSEPVRMSLPGVRIQSALETLVRTYDCTLEVTDDIVIVRRQDPSALQSRVFILNSTAAIDVQTELSALAGEGAIVVVNAEANVVMVTAPASVLRDVEAYVAAVDRPDRQVLIEARILEIDRSDMLELGSAIARNDIRIDDWSADFVTSLLNPAPSVLAAAGNDSGSMDITLDMLRELVGLEILQRPRLVALQNNMARLEILSEVPYVETTTTTESNVSSIGAQTIEEVQFKNVGLELSITPTIQADGLVSLVVDQRVSVQTDEFNGIPVVDSRTINTSFVVREGDTIMIGGIMSNSQFDTETGVPLLMDIPWLGHLFKSDVRRTTSRELVILMTPRLVDPRSLGSEAVDHVTVELETLS